MSDCVKGSSGIRMTPRGQIGSTVLGHRASRGHAGGREGLVAGATLGTAVAAVRAAFEHPLVGYGGAFRDVKGWQGPARLEDEEWRQQAAHRRLSAKVRVSVVAYGMSALEAGGWCRMQDGASLCTYRHGMHARCRLWWYDTCAGEVAPIDWRWTCESVCALVSKGLNKAAEWPQYAPPVVVSPRARANMCGPGHVTRKAVS